MTEQQFYGEIAKMIMEALKRVEHDLNLAVGEMKITLELIKLDRFRGMTRPQERRNRSRKGRKGVWNFCAPWWSPICLKDELPPLYMPLFM